MDGTAFMAENTENHTIKLLQEMRQDMREFREEIRDLKSEVRHRFDEVDIKIGGLTHMVMLLASNMGGHEQRIDALETTVGTLKV